MYHSLSYLLFLLLAGGIYRLLKGEKLRRAYLAGISLLFIGWMDLPALGVTLALTLFTWLMSFFVKPGKRIWLALGILGLVGVLVLFKYLGFMVGIAADIAILLKAPWHFSIGRIAVPLGLSYLCFKYLSYLIDLFWGIAKRGSLLEVLCYGTLFTTFVAGPMERFEHFRTELAKPASGGIRVAFERISYGLFKKLVLGDWLAFLIAPVWDAPEGFSPLIRAIALIGYTFRIYFDFAGYSDIAVGASRFLGLEITENFDRPYQAGNISQFWRRWHISLSDWIRDYLFFPLSGISGSRFWNLLFVPIIAMGICGLWHGSAWNFVLWGVWHGLGISIYQLYHQHRRKNRPKGKKPRFSLPAISATFLFVSLGWLFFMGGAEVTRSLYDPLFLLSMLVLAPFSAIVFFIIDRYLIQKQSSLILAIYALLLTLLLYCGMNTGFIYAQF